MSVSQNYPAIRPSLNLNFARSRSLDPRITFTRASTATFTDEDGVIKTVTANAPRFDYNPISGECLGLLIEEARANIVVRSEDFSQNQAVNNVTISTDQTTAPDGTMTADLITSTLASTSNTCWVQALTNVTASTLTYTISCFVKQGTSPSVTLNIAMVGGTYFEVFSNFNFSTKAIGLGGGGAASATSGYQQLGNGWFRFWLSLPNNNTGTQVAHRVYVRSEGALNAVGDSVYLWGRMMEVGSFPTSYVPSTQTFTSRASSATYFDSTGTLQTAATNVARTAAFLPDSGGVFRSAGPLLLEAASTNSIRNNTMVGAVAGTPGTNPTNWSFVSTQSNGLTQTLVGTGTENGIAYIDYRFNGTTIASPFAVAFGFDAAAAAAVGQTWTSSIYLRLVAGTSTGISSFQLGLIENNSGGTFVGGALYTIGTPTSAGLSTQRYSATRTLSVATVGFCGPTMGINVAGSTAIDFTIRIGLPQLEQNHFPTSVIATSGATATRSADVSSTSATTRATDVAVITGTNFSTWYNPTEGTLFAAVRVNFLGGPQFPGLAYVDDGTTDNSLGIYINDANNDFVAAEAYISNANQYGLFSSSAVTANQLVRAITAYKANDFAAAFNVGTSTVGTDITGSIPVVDRLRIGALRGGGQFLNGTVAQLSYYPARLTNTQLQSIVK